MNAYEKLARALVIFDSYEHEKFVHAEHDLLFAGPDPATVSPDHLVELKNLGWQPDEDNCFVSWM